MLIFSCQEKQSFQDKENTTSVSNQLVTLFNQDGSQSTAYLKIADETRYVFPFAWKRYANTTEDPTQGEVSLALPTGVMKDIFVDLLNFSVSPQGSAAIHIIWQDGKQALFIYQLNERYEVQEIFSLQTQGQINIINNGVDDVVIQNDEPLTEGIQRTQYVYNGQKFVSVLPIVLDHSTAVVQNNTQPLSAERKNQLALLKGPWLFKGYIEGSKLTPSELEKEQVIVNFMPESQRIVFSRDNMAEIFFWRGSSSLISGLLISLQNSFLPKILHSAVIQFVNPEKIIIRFQGYATWTGVYEKMSMQKRNYIIDQRNMVLQTDHAQLSGSYISGDGSSYTFRYPYFTFQPSGSDSTQVERGIYAILRVNKQHILELCSFDQNNLIKKRFIYNLDYNERQEGQRLIRSFSIIPGELCLYGVVTEGTDAVIFEQASIIKES